MKNSVTVWLKHDEVPTIDFQEDCNNMVTLYLGTDLEIYMHMAELSHLSKRIERFIKEREDAISKR